MRIEIEILCERFDWKLWENLLKINLKVEIEVMKN
jgi:hypothetical protein